MASWKEQRHCAACHHGPMYLWSMNVATQFGYEVNQAQLDKLSHWMIESDEARIFPKPKSTSSGSGSEKRAAADSMSQVMMGQNNLSQPTIYMLPAVLSMSRENPLRQAAWKKLVQHLASAQHSDGSFAGRDAWRPIFNTPSMLTLEVATGLSQARAYSEVTVPESESVAKSAIKYLEEQPVDDSQQSLVYQTLLATAEPSAAQVAPGGLVQRLLELQRSDGGWAQTPERPSDAFATGQSMFALLKAGLNRNHPSLTSATAFLIQTQQSDGTWKMTSRPNPEDGMPATNLNPITYAATAWATLALITCRGNPSGSE